MKSGGISGWTDIEMQIDYREGNLYTYIYR